MTTTTAQGARMRCDAPGCKDIATVEVDAWAYCAAHSGAKRTPGPAPRPVPARPTVTAQHLTNVAPPPASPPAPAGIGLLLEQASGHSSKRVRNLGARIETQLDQLRAVMAELAADEQRKQAAIIAKEKAREEIARLEQQLAAARAALRGKPSPAAKPTTPRPINDRQIPCSKGCGRTAPNVQGIKAHERHCKANSAP